MRPHRLAWSRTPAFHAGDRGSNPLGDAKFNIVAYTLCKLNHIRLADCGYALYIIPATIS